MGRVERGYGACQVPCFEVKAFPGCASEAKDAPGCHDMVLVTIDPGVGVMSELSVLFLQEQISQ